MTATDLHAATQAAKHRADAADSLVIAAARTIAMKRRAGVPISDFLLDALMLASEEHKAASDAALAASIAETAHTLADLARLERRGEQMERNHQ